VPVKGRGIETEADWDHLRTPETYLGSARGEGRTSELPSRLSVNHWALAGEWDVRRECIVLSEPGGSIAFRFHARDAHLVLARRTPEPIPFRVLLDGEPPGGAHGVDIGSDGHGLLGDGDLYQLVREPATVRERTLEVSFLQPGAEAYAFTFG
jgi:hypothetical protein